MAKACAPEVEGEPTATTFRGSLAQSWVHLWVVSHAKMDGLPDECGWGKWPMVGSGADSDARRSAQKKLPTWQLEV